MTAKNIILRANIWLLPYFSQLILGLISISGSLLESWKPVEIKTVPVDVIWPRFGQNIELKPNRQFFCGLCVFERFYAFLRIS